VPRGETEEFLSRHILLYVRHYGEESVGGMNFVDAVTKLGSDEGNFSPHSRISVLCPVSLPRRQALFSRSFDNDDLLPILRKPVLIMHGAQDAIVKPFWDDAAAFNGNLRTFCERLEREAVS
jgi:non-heme chloroperoxidase